MVDIGNVLGDTGSIPDAAARKTTTMALRKRKAADEIAAQ